MTAAITIYDTTLRDGTQGEGVQVSVADKVRLAHVLDEAGFDFIEAGWPGANPRDAEFFERVELDEYRVDIWDQHEGFGSRVRVSIRATDDESFWDVQGVSHNIIDASSQAIVDAYEYAIIVISRQSGGQEHRRLERGLVQVN